MTLLTRTITYYFRCSTGHRFERAKRDAFENKWCPKCGMDIWLYGLKDSTVYDPDASPESLEDPQT